VAPIPHKCSVLLLKIPEVNNPGTEVREKLITMKGQIPQHPKFLNHGYRFLCPSLWVLSQFLSCCCSWRFKTNHSSFPLTLQPQLHYQRGAWSTGIIPFKVAALAAESSPPPVTPPKLQLTDTATWWHLRGKLREHFYCQQCQQKR